MPLGTFFVASPSPSVQTHVEVGPARVGPPPDAGAGHGYPQWAALAPAPQRGRPKRGRRAARARPGKRREHETKANERQPAEPLLVLQERRVPRRGINPSR